MHHDARDERPLPDDAHDERHAAPGEEIDIQQLAERVHRLMLAELRLELARAGGPRSRQD